MKKFLHRLRYWSINSILIVILFVMVCLSSCQKSDNSSQNTQNPADLPSDVIDQWLTLELRIYKDATGIPNGGFARPFAYSGISAYESLDPGTASWKTKYNGLSNLPQTEKGSAYYWPASVNATLAEFNRSFFTSANVNATDLAAIDSLEDAITATFSSVDAGTLNRSVVFGRSIADAVYLWSNLDGYAANNAMAYTPPAGIGLWVPTPPALAAASGPYWSKNRPIIATSGDNTQPGPPTAYSEDPNSAFYQMVNSVYMASKSLTTDQKNLALFWRDVPGVTTPGHWLSITQQVIKQMKSPLNQAAKVYALVGISLNDAIISVWNTKYKYNLVRPVTYIQKVIGDTKWLPTIATPAHPEYASAHAVVSAAASDALTAIYGTGTSFTDHTYDYLGFPARTFANFQAIGVDAGNSRFYGGIHYQSTIDAGLIQGRAVSANIAKALGPF
jgi:hypothetical protein